MAVDCIDILLSEKQEKSREQTPDSARVWRISRLAGEMTAVPVSLDQILRRERG